MYSDFAFISYAFKDKEIANSLCLKLERENAKCWIAPRDVPTAENFPGAIIEALRECSTILFLFSQNTKNSSFIINELTNATNYRKPIITIRLDDTEPIGDVVFFIGGRHWIDIWDKPLDMSIKNIIQAIENVTNKNKMSQFFKSDPVVNYIISPIKRPNIPYSINHLKISNVEKSEYLPLMQIILTNNIKYSDPINTNLLLDDWEIKFNYHLLKFKNQNQIKNWIRRRLEVFFDNPNSLSNLSLIDSLFILPPLQDHFKSMMLCLEKESRGSIMGPRGFGKKFFMVYLSHFWSLKYETPILFIENINLLTEDDWEAIHGALLSLTNSIDPKKKILLILHNNEEINRDIERNINKLVNLAMNTALSLFYLQDYIEIEEYKTNHNKTIAKLQSLLKISKKDCILIFDNNNDTWISHYKIWLILIFKNFFGINLRPLMKNIDDKISLFDFQQQMNLTQILNIHLLYEKGFHDKIISEIKIDTENVILHSFLIESLILIYKIDQAVEYLDEYKHIYEESQSIAKWYLLYGKSLSIRGLPKEAKENFNEAQKHSEFSDKQDIKNEIAQWMGNIDNN